MGGEYDFSGLSDYDLIVMQKEVRASEEDKDFLQAILVELGRRHIAHLEQEKKERET